MYSYTRVRGIKGGMEDMGDSWYGIGDYWGSCGPCGTGFGGHGRGKQVGYHSPKGWSAGIP